MRIKNLEMISRCSEAMNVLRTKLKEQEASNRGYREDITAAWGNRERDEELQFLHRKLSDGKKVVRTCQTALHELKYARSMYNATYDRFRSVIAETMEESAAVVN